MTRVPTLTAADQCQSCRGAGYRILEDRTGYRSLALCDDCTPSGPKPSKYRNEKTAVDGLKFDSKAEADRWGQLVAMQQARAITHLRRQVAYPIDVNGLRICKYVADFVYQEAGQTVVEDVKGKATPVYALKKKLMLAVYGIAIREVRK
jgi:hypothetical protein